MASGRNGSAKNHKSDLRKKAGMNDTEEMVPAENIIRYPFEIRYDLRKAAAFIVDQTTTRMPAEKLKSRVDEMHVRLCAMDRTKNEQAKLVFKNLHHTNVDYAKYSNYEDCKKQFHKLQLILDSKPRAGEKEKTIIALVRLWKELNNTPLEGTGFERGILRMILRAGFSTPARNQAIRIAKETRERKVIKKATSVDTMFEPAKRKLEKGPSSGSAHFVKTKY